MFEELINSTSHCHYTYTSYASPTMRLLKLKDDCSFGPKWFSEDKVPPYAILSHTWGTGENDEVTFQDLTSGTVNNKPGFQKLQFCSQQAKHDDLHYVWVDTCCINKQDLNELTAAINSMFRWYQNAARCYVYLSDVSVQTRDGQSVHVEWGSAFRNSRWFSRGWTLQELLAPNIIDFYSRDSVRLGDKSSLKQQITEITGIPIDALQGQVLSKFSIEERFSWVETRQTTKAEDKAYCLLGLFQVFLPLIYGEGQSNAIKRLRREIQGLSSTDPQLNSTVSPSLSHDFANQPLNKYRSTKLQYPIPEEPTICWQKCSS
jgi:hypothetical protein